MGKRGFCVASVGLVVAIGCGSEAADGLAHPSGGRPLSASCTRADQCAAGQGCAGGICGACATEADCMPGNVCANGVCGACTSNSQCKDGKACVDGACGGCTDNAACSDGKVCNLGSCGACTSNKQCGLGRVCVDGACACTTNAQCPGGQECIDNRCTAPAKQDGGTNGSANDSRTDAGVDACASRPVFKTVYPNVPSKWVYNGFLGTSAGNEMCKAIGGDHFCDYEEIKTAQARGELAAANLNTTAWVHRTTPAVVNGETNSGGPGARCNDWRYDTNHANNGEFATISGANVTFDLAPANMTIAGSSPSAGTARMCGNVTRAILCCNARCP